MRHGGPTESELCIHRPIPMTSSPSRAHGSVSNLQLPLARPGVLCEDVEDESSTIDNLDTGLLPAELYLQTALLTGAKLIVKDHSAHTKVVHRGSNLLHLRIGEGIRARPLTVHVGRGLHVGREWIGKPLLP